MGHNGKTSETKKWWMQGAPLPSYCVRSNDEVAGLGVPTAQAGNGRPRVAAKEPHVLAARRPVWPQ